MNLHRNANWTKSVKAYENLRNETREVILQKTPSDEQEAVERLIEMQMNEETPLLNKFIASVRNRAIRHNISHIDAITKMCVHEMPPQILDAAWSKCRDSVLNDADENDRAKLDGFLHTVELKDLHLLSSLPAQWLRLKTKSAKSATLSMGSRDNGLKAS